MDFGTFGLVAPLLKAVEALGYTAPTEIQEKAIPILLTSENDFIGQAQTGTGKTAAFVLPLLQRLDEKATHVQALVLAPTRELANQVCAEVDKLGKFTKFRSLAIYGGTSYERQIKGLRNDKPQIVVGTPGRVIDLMEKGVLKLNKVSFVVLDEADEMLNMGFFEDVTHILSTLDGAQKMWMFSATMPRPILDMVKRQFRNPEVIKIAKKTLSNEDIEQRYYLVRISNQTEALCRIVAAEADFHGIVFCRTKVDTRNLGDEMHSRGFSVDVLNGDMGQGERDAAMSRFKSKKVRILICTDVAARGIDVDSLTHVVNFGLPLETESYVHRIGRTGRAGQKGVAITLVEPSVGHRIRYIEEFIKCKIQLCRLPSVDSLKTSIVMKQLNEMATVVEKVKEKGAEFAVDETFELFKDHFSDISKEDLLKIFFTRAFNRDLRRLDEIGPLDVEPRGQRGSSSGPRSGPSEDDRRHRNRKASGDPNRMRFFLNMGRKDGLQLKSFLSEVAKMTGLRMNDIQNVQMKDSFSFLEVPASYGDELLKKKDLRFNKRPIHFESAKSI